MKKSRIICPYCGAKATLHPSKYVYGKDTKTDGLLYVCDKYPECDSYVGAHLKTKLPMGTLANGDLRNKRIKAHRTFDTIWQSGVMTKEYAYKWMEIKLGLSSNQAHIGMFNESMCDKLIEACNQVFGNLPLIPA